MENKVVKQPGISAVIDSFVAIAIIAVAIPFFAFMLWASVRNPPIPHYSERISAEYGQQLRKMGIAKITVNPPLFREGTARALIHYQADGHNLYVRADVNRINDFTPSDIHVDDDGIVIKGRGIKRGTKNFPERDVQWKKIASAIEASIEAVSNSEATRINWES